jgi:protein ImuB
MVSGTGARRPLTAWAGPWPLEERWWDAAAARSTNRFQAVDGEGVAWLLVLDDEGWWAEGRYD